METGPASSSHDRLLEAAKILFATRGYENTSTAAVARMAGTSESQLVKHFGGKEGLLTAVFDHGWNRLSQQLQHVEKLPAPEAKLARILEVMLSGLEQDEYLRDLMLLEGRRIRAEGHMVVITAGYLRLVEMVDGLINQLRREGRLNRKVSPQAVRSALIGMLESMVRDLVLAQRIKYPAQFDFLEIQEVFRIVLTAFVQPPDVTKSNTSKKSR